MIQYLGTKTNVVPPRSPMSVPHDMRTILFNYSVSPLNDMNIILLTTKDNKLNIDIAELTTTVRLLAMLLSIYIKKFTHVLQSESFTVLHDRELHSFFFYSFSSFLLTILCFHFIQSIHINNYQFS